MNYIIFGGTGTLGKALTKIILSKGPCRNVVVVSRDELKQQEMRKEFPQVRYVLGDVSTTTWQDDIPRRHYDAAFNLAAVKHVDVAEVAVAQCFRVNTIGTQNTAQWALNSGVKHYCLSSTDKAVLPINAYGYSKGLAEKLVMSMNGRGETSFKVFTWGNVAASRGSVLHSFLDSLQRDGTIHVTDPRMTRFWAHIDDVAQFMWDKHDYPNMFESFIPPMKASTVLDMGRAVAAELGVDDPKIVFTGIRAGEKLHECLRSAHDYCITSQNCEQYTFDELRALARRALCLNP